MAAAEALVQSVGSSTVIFPNLSHHHENCIRTARRDLGERGSIPPTTKERSSTLLLPYHTLSESAPPGTSQPLQKCHLRSGNGKLPILLRKA